MLKQRKMWFRVAFALLIAGAAFLVIPPYENYCQTNNANEKYCSVYEVAMTFGLFLDAHNGVVTAIATVFIGLFTYTLKTSTTKLWDAGERQLAHLEETAERKLRAYVNVENARIDKVETGAPVAVVTIKNFGQTPAYNVAIWIHMWIAEHPLVSTTLPVPPEAFAASRARSTLAPGAFLINYMPKEPPVPNDSIPLLGTTKGTIYVYGKVTYRDAFKKEQWTDFRLMYGGQEGVRGPLMKHDHDGNECS